jgi:membrane-bound serine protease (ClpP class)
MTLVLSIAVGTGAFFAFAVSKALRIHKRQATTGREALAGKIAVVRSPLDPEGTVLLKGELWKARASEGPIEAGESVLVTDIDGFTLLVRRESE